MTKKRTTTPKLYKIETFRRFLYDHNRGCVREYYAAGNNRKQAIVACCMQSSELILSIECVGRSAGVTKYWRCDK